MKQSLEVWGATPDCLPAWMKATDLNEFEVAADNVPAFKVFRRVQTQWRVNFGTLVGLDYNVVLQVIDLVGISKSEKLDCLDRIRSIEAGYTAFFNK